MTEQRPAPASDATATAVASPPVVSIITPTFGHEHFIRRCLESVLGQTDPRWEQLIVDDGSADATQSIVESLHDERITYIRLPHRGIMALGASYNHALAQARGRYVAILEGDDFWPDDKIERQLPSFARPDIVLSWGRAAVTNEAGDVQHHVPATAVVERMRGRTPGETARALLRGNVIPSCTVMCRRDALLRIGGFRQPDGIPTTDYPTWLELCRVGSFASSGDVLGFYRSHPRQITVQNEAAMIRVLDWGSVFVAQLPRAEREALGLTMDEVGRIQRERHGYLAYSAGRQSLRRRDRGSARRQFRRALRAGDLQTRLKSLLGLGCSILRLDLEQVIGAGRSVARRARMDG